MAVDTHELKDQLAQADAAFRQLVIEHHDLDERIRRLSNSLLTAPEQLEEVALKKRKLHLKDQMESILREHAQSPDTAIRH
jgi:uncharacterized protein YdcH (DUF465 family)